MSWAEEVKEDVVTLDPIIISAQRYESEFQNVPASVEVITREDLEQKNISRLSEALRLVPNTFVLDDGGSFNTAISVRGIGNEIPFTDPAVSVFVNGVPLSGNVSDFDLQNVERIEVIRGPQSTLYGQNTLAGAVNIVTTEPAKAEWSGAVRGEIGNQTRHGGSAGVSGPLLHERVGLSLDVGVFDTDGYLTNATTNNNEAGEQNNRRVRAVVDVALTETFDAALSFDYNREEGAKTDSVPRNTYEFARASDPEEIRGSKQGALSLTWNAGPFDVTSVTGIRDVTLDLFDNMVLVAGNETTNFVDTSEDDIFQELRAVKPKGQSTIGWQVGAFVSDQDFTVDQTFSIPAFATTQVFDYKQGSLRTEGYGQLDLEVLEGLTLTAGGRLSRVRRSVDHAYILNGTTAFATNGDVDKTFDNAVGRVALTYAITDEASIYAGFSQGFKPGTARSGATSAAGLFLPSERSDTFEIGAKGTFDWLTFAASLFYTDYENRHTFFYDGGVPVTEAVPDAEARGGELSLDIAVTDAWGIYGRAGYLDTEFGSYILTGTTTDIEGNEFRDAPRWTVAVGTDYSTDLVDGWELWLTADLTFRTRTHGNVSNLATSINPAFALVDAGIGVQKGDVSISLTARNLLDRYYYMTTAINDGTGAPGPPRTVFLTASYRF